MSAKVIWSAGRFGNPKKGKEPNVALRKLDEAVARSQRMLEYFNTFSVNRDEVLKLMDSLRGNHDVHKLVDTILDSDQTHWRSHETYYLAVIKLLEEKISPDDSPA